MSTLNSMGPFYVRLTDDQIKGLLPTIARAVGGLKLLAFSGRPHMPRLMSLSGVKQTSLVEVHMSAFDPKRT